MAGPAAIKQTYRQFADVECRGYSDLYYALALAVADDDEVVGFIAGLPVVQPNLFLAAIQFLTGPESMPRTGAGLRTYLKQHGAEVADVMRSHRTQTNEVGRCAVLLPALPPGPLALIEVGASAGLCLLLDRYRYEFGATALGDAASPVRLQCTATGPVPLPTTLPQIVWRRGLDLNPISVHDDQAVRWLLACVWPDHPERRRRLEAAIDLARRQAPEVVAGDLGDDLPALLAEVPTDAQLVVFHSAVLNYAGPVRRQRFADALADASNRRDIVWLSNEPPGAVRELAHLATELATELAPAQSGRQFLLGRTRFAHGGRHDELLALAHPHGAELGWL